MSGRHGSPWREGLGFLAAGGEIALLVVAVVLIVAAARWLVRLVRSRAS
jgi:hypothetical protein